MRSPRRRSISPFATRCSSAASSKRCARLLSPFRLPRELTLEVKGCDGSVDAYYWNGKATLCYEYVELIQQHAPKVGTPGGLMRADAIVGAIADTVLHEVGHAVIDMLDLPVLGREEDAADFFSVYILTQFLPEDAHRLFQGVGFMMASEAKEVLEKPHDAKSYAGPHGHGRPAVLQSSVHGLWVGPEDLRRRRHARRAAELARRRLRR